MRLAHLPRTLHMRIMLGIGLLQLFVVGLFSVYWIVQAVGEELTARQALAHKILSLTVPAVERLLAQREPRELQRYLGRVSADPLIASVEVRDPQGTALFTQRKDNPALHPIAGFFRLSALSEGLSTHLWRDGEALGVMSLTLSNRSLNASIERLLENVMYLLFVLLALDLIAIQIVIRFFVAPLGQLSAMARGFSAGNLDTTMLPPQEGATQEVRDLTQAFLASAQRMKRQIAELEAARAQLKQNELRLRNLIDNMGEVLVELDTAGRIRFLNPTWERITGFAVERCLDRPFAEFLTQPSQQAQFAPDRLEHLPRHDMQIEVRAADGRTLWLRMNTALQYDAQSQFAGLVSTLEDISETRRLQQLQREHEADLYRLTITDPLTGVFNRRHFDETLASVMAANLAQQRQVALVIIDIDGFKFINDTYGHPVGDQVLRRVAETLTGHFPAGSVARLAGDEFAVVLQDTGEDEARTRARRLHQALSAITVPLPVGELRIQTSIGVATAPAFGKTPQELVRAADVALYHAKKSGRNRVDALSKDMGEAIMDIFSQGFELRNALNAGMIAPFLQPIFDLRTDTLMAYEVLMRLKRGDDYVPADEFVLVAEDLGLIREMDLFTMEKALQAVPKGVHLFVNISMASFFAPDFRDAFLALLASPPAQGRQITIEFTERQTIEMTADFFALLEELRRGGCKIALDDFGAGYSTYSYLRRLKPDFVKIDGSFVQHVLDNPQDRKIVEHIRELSEVFGAQSIAEHVEDQATVELLRTIGVDYAQGFFYGKPCSVEAYLRGGAPC